MNVKGIKLTKKIIEGILPEINDITIDLLKGLDTIRESYNWNQFNKSEFTSLLSSFNYLLELGVFKNISNNQQFVFNYTCDITEMDIVSVLTNKDKPIFINIECKNDDAADDIKLKSKMDKQLKKRTNNDLSKMLINTDYILIGMINNKVYKIKYCENSKLKELNVDELISLINKFSTFDNFDSFLLRTAEISSIYSTVSQIKDNNYTYFDETISNYNNFIKQIGINDLVLCYGSAGSGKTILALKLYFEQSESKLLLLNSKLFYALKFESYYFQRKATFNYQKFLEMIDENSIAIIDEVQRLSYDELVNIVKKAKFTIAFGDDRQAIFEKSTLLNIKELSLKLRKENNFKVFTKKLKSSRRYSDETDKTISYLTAFDENNTKKILKDNYHINIYFEEKEFLNRYNSLKGNKKIFVPFSDNIDDKEIVIDGSSFRLAENSDDYFAAIDTDYYSKLIGNTYHALSFDVDYNFVYLNKSIIVKYGKKKYIYKNEEKFDIDDIKKYMNELNVLFTRGRKSLDILVNDIKVYLYLKSRLNKIYSN